LTRADAEDYCAEITLDDSLGPRCKVSYIASLKTFFEDCQFYGWYGAPTADLILPHDMDFKYSKEPHPIPEEVINQLNQNLDKLPAQIGRMVFTVEHVGMRADELCTLCCDCLSKNGVGAYTLTYMQEKTHRINTVPVTDDVGHTIEAAIQMSRDKYGSDVKYAFASGKTGPITSDSFNKALNALSVKCNIRDAAGNLYHFRNHAFRATVGTNYANGGLGHADPSSSMFYIKMHDPTVTKVMRPLMNEFDTMIRNIGKPMSDVVAPTMVNELALPLANGLCMKSVTQGRCLDANHCYGCSEFQPIVEDLSVYVRQLEAVRLNAKMARLNGYDRIAEMHEDLIKKLEHIVNEIRQGSLCDGTESRQDSPDVKDTDSHQAS
jgi:integrase